jgi:RNA ligase (TIGR02306 family)
MSEFNVVVVEIGKVGKHPNADNLSITQIMGGYPCIFRTGDFKQGDKAVYIPVDALVPLSDPRWEFLRNEKKLDKTHEKIKARRLRGIFSMGLLTPANDEWEVGKDVRDELHIDKYEGPVDVLSTSGTSVVCALDLPVYDLEGLRKYKHILRAGEEVVCTEKLHGCNSRYVVGEDGKFWAGSHKTFKKETPGCLWWDIVKRYDLQNKLASNPKMVIYGEIYGQVQDLRYDAKPGEAWLRVFDVLDLHTRSWLNYDDCVAFANKLGLDMVPLLYRGPWNLDDLLPLANGKSMIANNTREGFVVKPVVERYDMHHGRVAFKMVGEDYLLRKEK